MRRERMVAMGAPERLRWGPKVSRWRRFYPRLFASAGPAEDLGVEEVGSFTYTHLVLTPSIDTLSAVCGRGPEAVGPGRCQEDRLRQARRWVKFWVDVVLGRRFKWAADRILGGAVRERERGVAWHVDGTVPK
ncbi:hypothetical protein BHE74_00023876 [Ensete ventricosum]|nr:hypothetical protein BHE74_00023876 [Ensete ventricosum]